MHQVEVFQCVDRTYTAAEVVSAADFRGELPQLRVSIAAGCAAVAHAEAEDVEVDEALLQQCSEQYRRERGLESSEATTQWLAAHALDLDDFADFLERRILVAQCGDKIGPVLEAYPQDMSTVQALLWPEIALAGATPELAMWLARRVALRGLGQDTTVPGQDACRAERTRFFERTGLDEKKLSIWCAAYGLPESWVDELTCLEAMYRAKRRELLHPEAYDRELLKRRQDLMCIEVEASAFDTLPAAREAYLCVTEDGEALTDVSDRGGAGLYHESVYLESLDERLQQQLLSGAPGDVIRPFESKGKCWVYRIRSKKEPGLDDEHVRERLEHALITRYFDELVVAHVRFFDPPHNRASEEPTASNG